MEKFLQYVSADLFGKYKENICDLSVVFPNRRAGFFFTKYLNLQVNRPLITPEILSISDLFASLSGAFVPDRLNLVFRLYKIYKEITHSDELFDDFYHWGNMLVSDFDQVDKYLVNAQELFTNITDLKEIDQRFSRFQPEDRAVIEAFWKSVLTVERSPDQEEFVRLWKELANIYQAFKTSLDNENLAYEGMLYRNVIEKITGGNTSFFEHKQFAFIGFNALNNCEEKLFDYLSNEKKALFYWDYDNYYFQNKEQEAGLFMRKNLGKYPQHDFSLPLDSFTRISKSARIVNTSSQTGQAQIAAEALTRLLKEKEHLNFDDTAIVLCDEELLLPVISAIPDEAGPVNITMGFPVNMTGVFSLITLIADLQKNARKSKDEGWFYFKNVLNILSHHLVNSLESDDCKYISSLIKTKNIVYLREKDLRKNKLFELIFTCPRTLAAIPDYLLEILKILFTQQNENLSKEYIYQVYLTVNKFRDLILQGTEILGKDDFTSFNTFFRLLNHYLKETVIPFEGEPIEGLQVLGILETRCLDFRNVILLSVNDGIMPGAKYNGSFIPYNLKRTYGLPAIEEENAVYAYYFYRLLQRSKDITFVYNSGATGIQTGEKSRFLYQLQMESHLDLAETPSIHKLDYLLPNPVSLMKDARIVSLMEKYMTGEATLSPTAIDKYLTCSLSFYFRYVAGIKEPEEISGDIDSRIFGILFHRIMEDFYSPLKGKVLCREDLSRSSAEERLQKVILDAFRNVWFKGLKETEEVILSGKNLLIFEILRKYMLRILEMDGLKTPFSIEGLEVPVRTTIALNGSQEVTLSGIIDRFDRVNGEIQVLDYKTGKTDLSYDMLQDLFDQNSKSRNKAAFQTLAYSFMLYKNHPDEKNIKPGIFDLRSIFEKNYSPGLKSKENGNKAVEFVSIAGQFEALLKQLLSEIFDPGVPFEKTNHDTSCGYCAYKKICQR